MSPAKRKMFMLTAMNGAEERNAGNGTRLVEWYDACSQRRRSGRNAPANVSRRCAASSIDQSARRRLYELPGRARECIDAVCVAAERKWTTVRKRDARTVVCVSPRASWHPMADVWIDETHPQIA